MSKARLSYADLMASSGTPALFFKKSYNPASSVGAPASCHAFLSFSGLSDPFVDQEPQEYKEGEAKLDDPEYKEAEDVKHADYYGEDFKSKVVDEMMAEIKDREQHVSKYMKEEK